MVALLVADMLRRTRVALLLVIPSALLAAWDHAARPGGVQVAMAVSMAITFMLGPIVLNERLRTPLIPYLPVSRRDVWRARWLMSTIAPATLVAALTVAVTPLNSAVTWSVVALSASMNLLYAGAGCALVAAGLTRSTRPWITSVTALILILGMPLPFLMRAWFPLQWHDMGAWGLLVCAGAAALTAWGALHTPSITHTPTARPHPASSTAIVGPAPRDWGLSGLPRLVVRELGRSLMMLIVMLGTFAVMAFVFERWVLADTTARDALVARLFFFARHPAPLGTRGFDVTVQWGWSALYAAAVFTRFPRMLRHLRVLPIGRARLLALLLGWPAVVWSLAWLLLSLVRRALLGPAPPVDHDWLVLFTCIGLSSLAVAIGLRFSRLDAPGFSIAVPMVFPVWQIVDTGRSAWLLPIGLLSLGLAAALNVNALSRSTTYKRSDPVAVRGA